MQLHAELFQSLPATHIYYIEHSDHSRRGTVHILEWQSRVNSDGVNIQSRMIEIHLAFLYINYITLIAECNMIGTIIYMKLVEMTVYMRM